MDFILLLEKLPMISKKDVNEGKIPIIGSKIASFLRNIFLISNGIRKENNIYIYCAHQFEENLENHSLLVNINGNFLRYLSPDERVTLLILQKIILVSQGTSNKKIYKNPIKKFKTGEWVQSTPGIKIKNGYFDELINSFQSDNYVLFNIKKNRINGFTELKEISDINELASSINEKSMIIFDLGMNESDLEEIFAKINNTKNKTIINFSNNINAQHFFDYDIIGMLQVLYENIKK
ncbi:MAG: hypothetical protein GY870_20770 [archaeon]|nr:hypothetical protein [archaeon]